MFIVKVTMVPCFNFQHASLPVYLQRTVNSRAALSPDSDSRDETTEYSHALDLCLRGNYKVGLVEAAGYNSIMIVIEPSNPSLLDYQTYKLSCAASEVG